MHPIYILAFATFGLLLIFLGWNFVSTRRSLRLGAKAEGIGSSSDPMVGNPLERSAQEMRDSLDAASSKDHASSP